MPPVLHSLGCLAILLLSALSSAARADSVVVFNEIMYHPATNELALEWVELHNQMSVDVDLSGWRLGGGLAYTFPNDTVIKRRGYLVVAVSPETLEPIARITNVFGPFNGRLANSGERLELYDLNNRLMDDVSYGTDGDWPAGADGSGVSLAKKHPNLASQPAESWTVSAQIGGTPGAENFPVVTGSVVTGTTNVTLVPFGASWRYYQSGDPGAGWSNPGFDAGAWRTGPALLGFETSALPFPLLTTLALGETTYYFRTAFAFAGNPAGATLRFEQVVDDGLVIYLNGVEVLRTGLPESPITHATLSSRVVGDAVVEGPFVIPSESLLAGNNVLAVAVHQTATTSSDIVFGLQLDAEVALEPASTNAPASPPTIAFNEVSGASDTDFWLELINLGGTSVGLEGLQVVRTGADSPSCTLAGATLPPGGLVRLPREQLGFGATNGQKLFLFTSGRSLLLDAVTVKSSGRGRCPDGVGAWMYPTQPTPGASNVFRLHDEIVFNEVMYHAPPSDPAPAVTTNLTVVDITGTWRYNDSGADLGEAWREPGYGDSAWAVGAGPMDFRADAQPASTNTTLTPGRTTYYFRTTFNYNGVANNVTPNLRFVVDGGAVFYLNGVEACRQNMPAGAINSSTSASGSVGDAGYVGPLALPAHLLRQGLNVLAVEMHRATSAATTAGIVLSGGGLSLVEEGPSGGTPPMNLARQAGSAPFVIDSLSGYPIHNFVGLTDGVYGNANSWIGESGDPGYAGVRFGGLSSINSIAFGRDNTGTYNDRTLGTYTLQYTRVPSPGAGTAFTGNPSTGWVAIGTLAYQSAGAGFFANPSRRHRFTFTPVEATGIRLLVPGTGIGEGICVDELEVNPPETWGNTAFGAELVLQTILSPARPFSQSSEEWVEFYNRSTNQVDLTDWRIDGGIDYRFPTDTVMPAGGYLVVAKDATALRAKWPEVATTMLGNFSGRLRENVEVSLKDAAGNVANTIRMLGSGWSDGGGSSLELIDPRADNTNSAAWADSDEGSGSVWQTVTYRMVAGQRFGSTLWNEFRIGMLDAGEVLVDDVNLVRDPDGARQQLIQNGNFEITAGNTHWRMLGNHGQSRIIVDPHNPANHVLKVSATSAAGTSHNHVESSFVNNTAVINGREYEVSFRARWLAGSPQLSTRVYEQRLARTTILPVPARLGTPGRPNSRRASNLGPTLAGLNHAPIIPRVNEAVTISVRASDPDGVASITLNYRVNPVTQFTALPMTVQPDGVWQAVVPGQSAGKIIQFYVSALDRVGAVAFAPSKGADSRALYQVADAQGTSLPAHELRLIQLDADRDTLFQATNLLSQERLGATVIYDRSEVFYDAGVRLQGTAAGRARDGDAYVSYDIGFPVDHRFRGVHGGVAIDRSGRSPVSRQQDEIYILHMFQRARLPCHRGDLCYFIAPKTIHTGTAILQLGAYGGVFVDEQYGQEGSVFNLDMTYDPSITVSGNFEGPKLPVPLQTQLGTDFTDLGNDKEQYRAPFDIRFGERADDYTGIMRLCQTMGLPQDQFDAQIDAVLDVNEALRVTALVILCGIGDTYFSPVPSNPHNCRLFIPADGGPAQLLPWDMDFVFYLAANSSIFPTTSYNLSKLINHPAHRRLYLWHVQDLCQTVFNPTYMSPWLTRYGSIVGQNFASMSSYIQNRRNSALGQLPAVSPFAITSNGGNNFPTTTNTIALSGTAPLSVRTIEVNGISYPITWTSVAKWTFTVPLAAGINPLAVQGVDAAGLRASNVVDTITVTNNGPGALLGVVVNEWMADNASPGGFPEPLTGLCQDWFELYNPNAASVNLSGFTLTDTLSEPAKWTVPSGTVIGPYSFLLVWADGEPAQNGSDTNGDLHAGFKLNSASEAIALYSASGVPQHAVTFATQIQNVSQGLFPDGDTNAFHFMTNWTPRSSNRLDAPPAPNILNFSLESTGTISFSFAASAGRLYEIQVTENLGLPRWAPLTLLRALAATLTVTDTAAGPNQRFYRVVLVQ